MYLSDNFPNFDPNDIVYFDAEFELTPGGQLPPLPPPPGNMSKPDTIAKWQDETALKLRETARRLPFYGLPSVVSAIYRGHRIDCANVEDFFHWLVKNVDGPGSAVFVGFDVKDNLYLAGMSLRPPMLSTFWSTWRWATTFDPYQVCFRGEELRKYLPLKDALDFSLGIDADEDRLEHDPTYRVEMARDLLKTFAGE